MNFFKQLANYLKNKYFYFSTLIFITFANRAYADNGNPFCTNCQSIQDGDVTTAVGTDIVKGLRYMAIVAGGGLIIGGVIAVIKQLKHGSDNNEHSGMASTLLYVSIGTVVGVVLISFGWSAFNYTGG